MLINTKILFCFNHFFRLHSMELSPGETPHIAFRADHVNLKESIMKYGRVDANSLSFAAFEDPDIPSASLPSHLEDYEDVDHHVFNKPVQSVVPGNATSCVSISWSFSKSLCLAEV